VICTVVFVHLALRFLSVIGACLVAIRLKVGLPASLHLNQVEQEVLRGELDLTDEGALELFKDGLEEKLRALLAASGYKKVEGVWHACALGAAAVSRRQALAALSAHVARNGRSCCMTCCVGPVLGLGPRFFGIAVGPTQHGA
jgi:hypothetical protein